MPDFKEFLRKSEKYGEGALAYTVLRIKMEAFSILKAAMSEKEFEEYKQKMEQYEALAKETVHEQAYNAKSGMERFPTKMPPNADKLGMELLEMVYKSVKRKREELAAKNDPFLPVYDYVLNLCAKDTNLLEAKMESQYLNVLNQYGGTPDLSKDHDFLIQDLRGDKDEKTGAYKGPLYPLMDYYKSYNDLEKIEAVRQKNNMEGWTAGKEQTFLADLKEKQERIIADFEKLYNLEDKYQFHTIQKNELNNDIAHITGKGDNRRSAYSGVNVLRGQIKAIENGWSHDELTVLGAIANMEAEFELFKIDFDKKYASYEKEVELHKNDWTTLSENKLLYYRDAHDAMDYEKANKAKMAAFEKDIRELKEKVWDRKVTTQAEKNEVLNLVSDFIKGHKNIRFDGLPVTWTNLSEIVRVDVAETFVSDVMAKDPLSKNTELFKGLHTAMENSKIGVRGGTQEYNRIVVNIAALGIKAHNHLNLKEAFNDPAIKADYDKIIAALDKYLNRKNNEIEGARAKDKEPNKNSVMRRDTMEMVRRELRHAFEGKPLTADGPELNVQQNAAGPEINAAQQKAPEANAQVAHEANIAADAGAQADAEKAPAKKEAKGYKSYIRKHTGNDMGKNADEMIINASKCFAAGILNTLGKKFSISDIHKTAEKVRKTYALDAFKNKPEKLREMLRNADTVVASANQLRETLYGVAPDKRDKYFDDMKKLADNLSTTEGHGKQYAELSRLIKEAANLKAANLPEDQLKISITKYNNMIYNAAIRYIDSKGINKIDVEKNPRAAAALNAVAVLTKSTEGLNYRTTKLVVDLNKALSKRHSAAAANFTETAKFTEKYGAENTAMQREPVKNAASKGKKPVAGKN